MARKSYGERWACDIGVFTDGDGRYLVIGQPEDTRDDLRQRWRGKIIRVEILAAKPRKGKARK